VNNIDKIKDLMKQTETIAELIAAVRQTEIPAVYMREVDNLSKKQYSIDINKKWHRFFVETGLTPVNKWENLSHYSILLISDDLQEIKIIDKS
jgi:hypothetical protein